MKAFFSACTRLGSCALLFIAVFIGTTTTTHADVCAVNVASGGYNGSVADNSIPYGTPFTVSADCDVTDIKLEAQNNGAPEDMIGAIWDDNATVLVSGSANATDGTCTLYDSTVSSGTYTLTTGVTYHVGLKTSLTAFLRPCGYNGGGTAVQYYAPPWTDWVQHMNFEVDGLMPSPPPPPPPSSGFSALIGMATSSYESVTGISMEDVTTWTSDNLLKLFLGSGIATLYLLRFWIVALIMFGAVVYFSFRALGFFKY